MQDEQAAILRNFPPRTLPDLVAQRDALLAFAAAEPGAVLAGFCATYILMQVRCIPSCLHYRLSGSAQSLVAVPRDLGSFHTKKHAHVCRPAAPLPPRPPQTFAIPGTIMLSLLAGGLYGPVRGAVLVAAVSTAGSCACYSLSWAVGAPLARALWPARLERYAVEVAARRRQLLNYLLVLRVTPILPNT